MATGIHLGPFSLHQDAPARILRGAYRGVVLVDERPLPVAYVLDPATGNPVVPLAADGPDAIDPEQAEALVMMIPDEGDGCLQLQAAVIDLDPHRHEAPDRHLIYHGPSNQRRWGLLEVSAARVQNRVFDAQLIIAPNPLRSVEPALCKWANSHTQELLALAQARLTPRTDLSVMVGIDPMGIDIRTRFGPQRIEFGVVASDPTAARTALSGLIGVPLPPAAT